ncbi:MAG TPA: hypothetical protein VIV60_23160, partial [Polyangiaceae bacterium]
MLTLLLSLLVAGSLLAVGTVHVATLIVIAPIAIVAGALAVWVEDQPKQRRPLPALVALGLASFSLLQSIPLPPSWAKALSPMS